MALVTEALIEVVVLCKDRVNVCSIRYACTGDDLTTIALALVVISAPAATTAASVVASIVGVCHGANSPDDGIVMCLYVGGDVCS